MALKMNAKGDWSAQCGKCGRMVLRRYGAKWLAESALSDHERRCNGKPAAPARRTWMSLDAGAL
jgi:hypothetical protein